MSNLVVPAWAWGLLAVVMLLLIAIDLFAHRGDRIDSRGRALVWSVVWVAAAVVFGGFVAIWFGADAAEQYFAAYLLEKSLSVDNLFVFVVIFGALDPEPALAAAPVALPVPVRRELRPVVASPAEPPGRLHLASVFRPPRRFAPA